MSQNNHVLDIYLAEELARAYETALQANVREQDMRTQCNAMREHINSLDDQLRDRDAQLAITTERHNNVAISNERLRRRLENMENAMTALRTSIARYRAESANTAYRRIPESFRPILRRVRMEMDEERRIRRRLDFESDTE